MSAQKTLSQGEKVLIVDVELGSILVSPGPIVGFDLDSEGEHVALVETELHGNRFIKINDPRLLTFSEAVIHGTAEKMKQWFGNIFPDRRSGQIAHLVLRTIG